MPFPIVILQTVKQLDQLLPEDFGGLAELRKINAENVVVLVQIRTDPFFTFSYVRALIEARSQISRMVNNLPSTFTRRCSISMYRPRAALGSWFCAIFLILKNTTQIYVNSLNLSIFYYHHVGKQDLVVYTPFTTFVENFKKWMSACSQISKV